ncbi:MAG: DNA ligase-1 [Limisphaerales bacterium]|jgi:DNA ligase-1
MRRFITLLPELDGADDAAKLRALTDYFRDLPDGAGAWAVWLFLGNRPERLITNAQLREGVIAETKLPAWLVDESCKAVDDPCETFALLLDTAGISSAEGCPWSLDVFLRKTIPRMSGDDATAKRKEFGQIWRNLSLPECHFFHRLVTGTFRISVPQRLVVQALSKRARVPDAVIALRLKNGMQHEPDCFKSLLTKASADEGTCQPYPFGTTEAITAEMDPPGSIEEWQIEYVWDGLRAQIIRRGDHTLIWNQNTELITESYPELSEAAHFLPNGTVLEGTLVALINNRPQPIARAGESGTKKDPTPATIVFLVSDMLEQDGKDLRDFTVTKRREILCDLHADWEERARKHTRGTFVQGDLFAAPAAEVNLPVQLADTLQLKDWDELRNEVADARGGGAEGLLLKQRSVTSRDDPGTDNCLLWAAPPLTVLVVLTAARQFDDGSPTEYVFAVWDKEALVTVTKATTGFVKEESADLRKFVREHTIERHGPVRLVAADLVFGLEFDGVHESSRHKSRLSLRNPRIGSWKKDTPANEASTLADLRNLIPALAED